MFKHEWGTVTETALQANRVKLHRERKGEEGGEKSRKLTKDSEEFGPLENSSGKPRVFRPTGQLLAVVLLLEHQGQLARSRVASLARGQARISHYETVQSPNYSCRRRATPGLAPHGYRTSSVNLLLGLRYANRGWFYCKNTTCFKHLHKIRVFLPPGGSTEVRRIRNDYSDYSSAKHL